MAQAPTLTRADVQARVKDWIARVEALHQFIRDALKKKAGFEFSSKRSVAMHEELMREYGVPEVQLPVLDVLKAGSTVLTFKPVGLWIIGANGRIDILSSTAGYTLVDVSAPRTRQSEWRVFGPGVTTKGAAFNAEFLRHLVS